MISAICQHDHAKPAKLGGSDWQEYAAVWQDDCGGGNSVGSYDLVVTSRALSRSGAASNPTVRAFYLPNYHADRVAAPLGEFGGALPHPTHYVVRAGKLRDGVHL
jgi:hypothetical protein